MIMNGCDNSKLIAKNGRPIFEDSLIKFYPHLYGIIWITKPNRIWKDGDSYTLKLCEEWQRNPSEVEVVTQDEAIMLAFEQDAILRF